MSETKKPTGEHDEKAKKSKQASDAELSEEQLEQVSGGGVHILDVSGMKDVGAGGGGAGKV